MVESGKILVMDDRKENATFSSMTVAQLMRNLGEMYNIEELKAGGNLNVLNEIVDVAIDKDEHPEKYPVSRLYFCIAFHLTNAHYKATSQSEHRSFGKMP